MFVETEERKHGEITEAPAKVLKLSEAVRECGYEEPMSYDKCVLGLAYRRLTGRSLSEDGSNYPKTGEKEHLIYTNCAAEAFGVPRAIALKAEQMCYSRINTKEHIADWLESQGY